MKTISPEPLRRLVAAAFSAAGCRSPEPERIAHYLVESNLVGHDSHGVIRVLTYIQWLREGKVRANQSLSVIFENDAGMAKVREFHQTSLAFDNFGSACVREHADAVDLD